MWYTTPVCVIIILSGYSSLILDAFAADHGHFHISSFLDPVNSDIFACYCSLYPCHLRSISYNLIWVTTLSQLRIWKLSIVVDIARYSLWCILKIIINIYLWAASLTLNVLIEIYHVGLLVNSFLVQLIHNFSGYLVSKKLIILEISIDIFQLLLNELIFHDISHSIILLIIFSNCESLTNIDVAKSAF